MARHLSFGIGLPSFLASLALAAAVVEAASPTDSFPFSGRILSSAGVGLDSAVVRVLAARGGSISYTTAVTTTRSDGSFGTAVSGLSFSRPGSAPLRIAAQEGTIRVQGLAEEDALLEARNLEGKLLVHHPLHPGLSEQSVRLPPAARKGAIVLVVRAGSRILAGPALALAAGEQIAGSGWNQQKEAIPAARSLAASGDTLHVWRPGYAARKNVLTGASGSLDEIRLTPLAAPQTAPAPLFKDPPHDGASDPTIVWVEGDKAWWVFYTARRVANCTGQCGGVAWVFGSNYGIASSYDGGATWQYRGVATRPGKPDLNWNANQNTFWAPEVVYDPPTATYHMYASITPGILTGWNEGIAGIVHLSAKDPLNGWAYDADPYPTIHTGIDAVVRRLGDGKLHLWGKFGDVMTSTDYVHWTKGGSLAYRGEGQYVFRWKGKYWLLEDPTSTTPLGLWVSSSTDGLTWTRQTATILSETNSTRRGDNADGKHPSVVVQGDRAYLIYFTEGGNDGTCLQAAELREANGVLTADRSKSFEFLLRPVSEYR